MSGREAVADVADITDRFAQRAVNDLKFTQSIFLSACLADAVQSQRCKADKLGRVVVQLRSDTSQKRLVQFGELAGGALGTYTKLAAFL